MERRHGVVVLDDDELVHFVEMQDFLKNDVVHHVSCDLLVLAKQILDLLVSTWDDMHASSN